MANKATIVIVLPTADYRQVEKKTFINNTLAHQHTNIVPNKTEECTHLMQSGWKWKTKLQEILPRCGYTHTHRAKYVRNHRFQLTFSSIAIIGALVQLKSNTPQRANNRMRTINTEHKIQSQSWTENVGRSQLAAMGIKEQNHFCSSLCDC